MDVFAALADPVRRALLTRLRTAPAKVVDLTAAVVSVHPVSRPAVSRHLRLLGEAGLVAAEDHGRERHYRLVPAGLTPLTEFAQALRQPPPFGEHALDGLELEVRRTVREKAAAPATPHDQENTA